MIRLAFEPETLSADHIAALEASRLDCAADIVTMTTLATCGHPGGSLSSLHALLLLYANASVTPDAPLAETRDRVFVSHGHISPGVYSTLAAAGFCDRREMLVGFRRFGSAFGGHVEASVPGVEWNTGNLGQGLSAAVGSALAARLHRADPALDLRAQAGFAWRVACVLGDGEQQKGQISEARRLAVKYGCGNLVALVDVNRLQIGGETREIMPQDHAAEWAAAGWRVVEVDGHDWQALYAALREAWRGSATPTVLLCRTVMSYGIPFMQDQADWHGKALSRGQLEDALRLLDRSARIDELDGLLAARKAAGRGALHHDFPECPPPTLQIGPPRTLGLDKSTDCRSAYGAFMKELAQANNAGRVRVAAWSADLEGSVKLDGFHAAAPAGFIEGGIQEHNSATASGRMSRDGIATFFSTFGVFGVTEVFNQQRLNDFNRTHLKLVCTHCGTDVGEDGPTHQVIDYVGLLRSTYGWGIHVPADPNQCDRILRAVAGLPGNHFVGMGRSKMATLATADGTAPFYGDGCSYTPGKADVLRPGDDGAILAVGPMVAEAVRAHDLLAADGLRVRVVNCASLRPFDGQATLDAARTGAILTAEDHHPDTGLGGLVGQTLADAGVACKLARAGVDRWSMSGPPADVFAAFRLDAAGLAARMRALLA